MAGQQGRGTLRAAGQASPEGKRGRGEAVSHTPSGASAPSAETEKVRTEASRVKNGIGNGRTGAEYGRSDAKGRCRWRQGQVSRALAVKPGAWSLDEEKTFKADRT